MARPVNRGEIWRYRFRSPDKKRPVLVITRPEVIPLPGTVMVAPITSTIRGAPSEVLLAVDEGRKGDSVVNLDHVQTVDKSRLTQFVGTVSEPRMAAVCRALGIAAGCT